MGPHLEKLDYTGHQPTKSTIAYSSIRFRLKIDRFLRDFKCFWVIH